MKRPYVGLILPEHQQKKARSAYRAVGYILRGAIAFLCSFAISRFVFDSIGADLPYGFVFGVCLASCLILGVMLLNLKTFAVGSLLLFSGTVWLISGFGKFFDVLYLMGASVYNAFIVRLIKLYFTSPAELVDISGALLEIGVSVDKILMLAAALIILVLSAICALCTVRRARFVPLLCLFIGASAFMMYFGAYDGTLSLALMLASLFGVSVLCLYDSVYCKKSNVASVLGTSKSSDSRRELEYTLRVNSALGGFSGGAATLAALIIAFIVTGISTPMPNVPAVSTPIEKISNYISALTQSEGAPSFPFSDDSTREERSTTASPRIFTGKQIFEIHTDVNLPIYLRSWVGTNYIDDSWHTVSTRRIEDYHKIFGDGFSHELLTHELLRAIDPTLTSDEKNTATEGFGYTSTYIDIKKKAPTSALVYLPSYTDQRTRLLSYGDGERKVIGGYSNYFDGIFTSANYVLTDEYAALARLNLKPTEDTVKNLGLLIQQYAKEHEILTKLRPITNSSLLRNTYDTLASKKGAPLSTVSGAYTFPDGKQSLAYRYAYKMTDIERRDVDALMDNLTLYYNFVYDTYLSGCEGFDSFEALISDIAKKNGIDLRRDAKSYDGRHRIVEAVIDYLAKNMTYTLNPKAPSGIAYTNAAHIFLFDTKEGYCSQYATAAVMLLRAAGIPARYAEGYVVKSFTPASDGIGTHKATVLDEDAHAWVEVYYDYYGWLTYEATSAYISDPLTPPVTEDTTDTTAPDDTTEPPEDTTDITPPDDTTKPIITDTTAPAVTTSPSGGEDEAPHETSPALTGTVCTVIAAALIAVCTVVIGKRAESAKRERKAILERARAVPENAAERVSAAREISEYILKLLALRSLEPSAGEPPSKFAARVDAELGEICSTPYADAQNAINAAQFAADVSSSQLSILCDYAEAISGDTLAKAGCIKALVYKYFLLIS